MSIFFFESGFHIMYIPDVNPCQVSGKGYSKRSLTGGISPLAKHLKYDADQSNKSEGWVRIAALV